MGSSDEAQESELLVERIVNGDKNAEEEIVKKYQAGLYIILKGQIFKGNESILDDVIQDTWCVVLQKIRNNEIKERGKFNSYLIAVGRAQLVMHVRKIVSRKTVSDDVLDLLQDEFTDPYELLKKVKKAQIVAQAIDQLPTQRDRDILKAHHLLEQNKETICENLGLSDAHFTRVIFRARNRLKQVLSSVFSKEFGDE